MLRRLGNKSKLLSALLPLFPEQVTTFIDLFMGSGAVTFAMVPRAKYIFANDKDEDVFNLFWVLKERPDELIQAIQLMPIHDTLFDVWNTHEETDPVWKAARFLMLSNFGLFGQASTLHHTVGNSKHCLLHDIQKVCLFVSHVHFLCRDFREVLPAIAWRHERDKQEAFIYCDPPYLGAGHNYMNGFTEQDTRDLFELLVKSIMRFGVSEFRHPLVLELAQHYRLHITVLGERQTLKSRQTELYLSNYLPGNRQIALFPDTPYITQEGK